MDTPGNVLKSERERQKKPLKEVARKLKINIKYLEAIEDNDYSVLPAEVFARSYIRLYADELDLDSTKLLQLFENIGKVPDTEEPKPQEQESVPPPSADKQKKSFSPLLIIVAAGLLILVLVLVSQKKERGHEETASVDDKASVHETIQADIEKETPPVETRPAEKKDRTEDTKPVVKPETSRVKDEEKRVVNQIPAPQREKPAAEQAPVPDKKKPVEKAAVPGAAYEKPSGEVTLKIVATELTWVSLGIDGGKPREWHLRAGQTITLKGQNGFRGKIGNAGGTKLYLNNKDIGELGPPGKIIDIVIPRYQ
jgi:cytoskeletal protein RodZ